MVERDVFGMTEEESDKWFESSVTVDKEIRSIVNLHPEKRKLTWKDGSELSFDESVQRIRARHPTHSEELIHAHLCGWLEQADLPAGPQTMSWRDWIVSSPSGLNKFPAGSKCQSISRELGTLE